MKESNGNILANVEGARGIAAVLVLLYHAARHIKGDSGQLPFGGISQFGHAGVDFFFVLSGFIIMHVHHKDIGTPASLDHYAMRRMTRIIPLYWVALAVTIVMICAAPTHNYPTLSHILQDVLLLPTTDTIVGVAWTLQHELMFYVFFALLIINRQVGVIGLGVWGGAIALTMLSQHSWESIVLGKVSSPYNLLFFMGMVAAYIQRHHKVPTPMILVLCGTALFLAFGMLENKGCVDGYAASARFAYGLSATLVLLGLVESECRQRLKVGGLILILGRASYSIYLLQFIIIGVIWKVLVAVRLNISLTPEINYLILVAAGAGGGVLASVFIERPLMVAARRFWAFLCRAPLAHGDPGQKHS